MKVIVLDSTVLEYLRTATYLPVDLLQTVLAQPVSESPRPIALELGDEEARRLRESLGSRLATVGFDADYSLTEEGRLLEDLIDTLAG